MIKGFAAEKKFVKTGIFGTITTTLAKDTGVSTVEFVETGGENRIEDYVFRQSGIQKELIRADRFSDALSNPKDYFLYKKTDLYKIGETLKDSFVKNFKQFLELGLTEEKARDKATKLMESEKEKLMVIHNNKFPTDINQKAVDKLLKTN